jgi:hypothetical protein
MSRVDAYVPGVARESCRYTTWWAVIVRDGQLLAAERRTAEAAARDAGVAVVALHEPAYHIAPSVRTRCDWVLKAAAREIRR